MAQNQFQETVWRVQNLPVNYQTAWKAYFLKSRDCRSRDAFDEWFSVPFNLSSDRSLHISIFSKSHNSPFLSSSHLIVPTNRQFLSVCMTYCLTLCPLLCSSHILRPCGVVEAAHSACPLSESPRWEELGSLSCRRYCLVPLRGWKH